MPAPHRVVLNTYPSVQACVAAIDALHAAYKVEHKRNASVDLFCSHTFSTAPVAVPPKRKVTEVYELTLSVTPAVQAAAAAILTDAQLTEIEWFKDAALSS